MWVFEALSILLIMSGLGMMFYASVMLKYNQPQLEKPVANKRIKPAILIPARDESRVISELLESLQKQSLAVQPEDIYVIVENEHDPTIGICQGRGVNCVVRQPPIKACKGAALDEAVQQILKQQKHYDLYFIFDADNLLSPDYLEKMLTVYRQGYVMATGYRMPKNGNQNLVTAASALTFTMVNVMGNRARMRHQGNVVFSGTGCFVAGKLVEQWQGWPFQSLTEDYEMSLYATTEGLPTFYQEKAIFYDEQPTKYHQTTMQRTRWIRGYFDARRIYLKQIWQKLRLRPRAHNYGSLVREFVGVTPLILMVAGLVVELITCLVRLIMARNMLYSIIVIVGLIVLVYIIMVVATIMMLKREKTKFRNSLKLKLIFYNPTYLLGYVPCALTAILKHKVTWQKIDHGEG